MTRTSRAAWFRTPAVLAGARMLGTAAAYVATAKAGLLVALVHQQVTPLWLPTGVAVACMLLMGARIWPGVAFAAFVVNLSIGSPPAAAAVIAVGNTLAPLCSYLLLRRVGFDPRLGRLKDALTLVFLGAFLSMLISATVGAGTLLATGVVPPPALWRTWAVWWTGDTMGVLVGVPLVLVARFHGPPRLSVRRWAEAALLLVGTLAVTVLVSRTDISYLFLVLPLLIWAALRFEHIGAAPCVLVVSVVVTFAAVHRTGPFAGRDMFAAMVNLQAFNVTATLTALLLAALTAERNLARREVERVAANLTRMAAELESGQLTLKGMVLDLFQAQCAPGSRPVEARRRR